MELKESSAKIPLISGYGEGGFRISGTRHKGHLLICATGYFSWQIKSEKTITKQSLKKILESKISPEFLILGLGQVVEEAVLLSKKYEQVFGVPCEVMTTGAAVRTYNVLALEGRRLAAAIMAI